MEINTDLVDKMFAPMMMQQSVRDNVATSVLSGGLKLMEMGKYKEAASAFRQATALRPDYVDAYNMMGTAYQKLGDTKNAEKAYDISIKLDKNQDEVHMAMANMYIEQKRTADAEKSLKAAMQANRANPLPHYTHGLLLQQNGKSKEAETAFRQALRLAPKDGNAYYGLATSLVAQNRDNEAIPLLQKAMQLKRDFAPAMIELGKVYARQGNEYKAEEMIKSLKALQTSQGYGFAADLEEYMRKPQMVSVVDDKTTMLYAIDSIPLLAVDPSVYIQPSASKEFSITFQFSTDMDTKSVTNFANWQISRASGGTGGFYDNGLYRPTDRAGFVMPNRVTYNPVDRQATVYFSISQNSDVTGTIDFKHLTFKFKGVDQSGKAMDPNADQFNGWANKTF